MNIGFFTDGYLPQLNGVATSVDAWAKELEKLGHKVYIVAPKYPAYKDKANNRIIRLPSLRALSKPDIRLGLPVTPRSMNKIYKLKLDIVHATSGGSISTLGLIVARAKKIPYVFTYYTRWNHFTHYIFKGKIVRPWVLETASKIFCNMCDCVIVPASKIKDELISFGIKKPIVVISSGVDIEKFNKQKKGFLRKKAGIKKGRILLYVGRLEKEKSVDFLFKAFKRIYDKDPQVNLVLIGDGSMKSSLEELARKLGIRKNVYFMGLIDTVEMNKAYADADLFVFASQTETQGMVILESLASGVPVVAIGDPAYDGIIKNKVNGILLENNNPDSFAKECLRVLDSVSYRKKLSENASKSMQNFSLNSTAKSFEKLYQKLITTL